MWVWKIEPGFSVKNKLVLLTVETSLRSLSLISVMRQNPYSGAGSQFPVFGRCALLGSKPTSAKWASSNPEERESISKTNIPTLRSTRGIRWEICWPQGRRFPSGIPVRDEEKSYNINFSSKNNSLKRNKINGIPQLTTVLQGQ